MDNPCSGGLEDFHSSMCYAATHKGSERVPVENLVSTLHLSSFLRVGHIPLCALLVYLSYYPLFSKCFWRVILAFPFKRRLLTTLIDGDSSVPTEIVLKS